MMVGGVKCIRPFSHSVLFPLCSPPSWPLEEHHFSSIILSLTRPYIFTFDLMYSCDAIILVKMHLRCVFVIYICVNLNVFPFSETSGLLLFIFYRLRL